MKNIRFICAFAGVSLTVLGTLSGFNAAPFAAAIFAVLVGLSLSSLNRTAKVFATLSAVIVAYALIIDGKDIDFTAGAFLFTFLIVSGSLRVAAANEQAIVQLGERLARIPPNRQFVLVSLSTALFALVLLNGALNFVSGIFASKVTAPLGERLRLMRTFISGFALNPILSPMAIPFVVISSMLPMISWFAMLPYLAICAFLVWASGRIQNIFVVDSDPKDAAQEPVETGGAMEWNGRTFLVAFALILTPIVTTFALVILAGLKPSHAALTSVFISSLVWPGLRLKKPRLIRDAYTVSINEATIIGGSLLLGTLLIAYFPSEWEQVLGRVLLDTGPFAPAIVILFFSLGSLVGLQPSICFLLAYAAIFPYANTVGDGATPVYVAIIVGWALNSLVSPFGLPVMVVSRSFNISSAEFALKHGLKFLLVSVFSVSLALTGSMFLGTQFW